MTKIAIALSGGVDSSVAAWSLLQENADLFGLFMCHPYQINLSPEETQTALQQWNRNDLFSVLQSDLHGNFKHIDVCQLDSTTFTIPKEMASALEIAFHLHIPLVMVDMGPLFEEIVQQFIKSYYQGRTPNPCILCNRSLKFGKLWEVGQLLGAELFATGHYVHQKTQTQWLAENNQNQNLPNWLVQQDPNLSLIERSVSPKDQSYVLYNIQRNILPFLRFPLGDRTKEEVRMLAQHASLPVASKKDSQEICFVENGKHLDFLHQYGPKMATTGHFVNLEGQVIGNHSGYERYTIGQRKGLQTGFGQRIFVQKILPETKEVVLGPYDALARTEIHAVNANWHLELPPENEFRGEIRIRYRNNLTPAVIKVHSDNSITAYPEQPCYGVADGQALVCYYGNRLLGGGTIG